MWPCKSPKSKSDWAYKRDWTWSSPVLNLHLGFILVVWHHAGRRVKSESLLMYHHCEVLCVCVCVCVKEHFCAGGGVPTCSGGLYIKLYWFRGSKTHGEPHWGSTRGSPILMLFSIQHFQWQPGPFVTLVEYESCTSASAHIFHSSNQLQRCNTGQTAEKPLTSVLLLWRLF